MEKFQRKKKKIKKTMSRSESPSTRSPSSLRPQQHPHNSDPTAEALDLALCFLNGVAPTADNAAYIRHTTTAPPILLKQHNNPTTTTTSSTLLVPNLKDRSQVLRECIAISTGLPVMSSEGDEVAHYYQLPPPPPPHSNKTHKLKSKKMNHMKEKNKRSKEEVCCLLHHQIPLMWQQQQQQQLQRQCDVPSLLADTV